MGAAYADNELYVTITKDENWVPADGRAGTTEEYKDKEGRVVLKRTFNKKGTATEMLSTYYVYDDFGDLCFVLPPGANPDSGLPSSTSLNNFCYQYRYDERKRMVEKKIPGAGTTYYVYNQLDQLVATKDPRIGSRGYHYTKYDALGRVTVTGWYYTSLDRQELQDLINTKQVRWESRADKDLGYDNLAWPESSIDFYVVNYYDDYDIYKLPNTSTESYAFQSINGKDSSSNTTGLQTGMLTRSANNSNNLWSVNYYDTKGRLIQVQSKSHILKHEVKDLEYNFVNQVTRNERIHTESNNSLLPIIYTYQYDHAGRKTETRLKLGDDDEFVLSMNAYNELGQLVDKKLHRKLDQTRYLQSVDYRYNIRGWLTSINDPGLTVNTSLNDGDTNSSSDQFGMELRYDKAASAQYNGNIGSMFWNTASTPTFTASRLGYAFSYDKLNRLSGADTYNAGNSKTGNYDELVSYDVMGNITSLSRNAVIGGVKKQIDNLAYTYKGNQLTQVDDGSADVNGFNDKVQQAGEIAYDASGNISKDLNKGISSMSYNILNLPNVVTFNTDPAFTISYEYERTGKKLRKITRDGTNTIVRDYIDGIEYETQGSSRTLQLVTTEEGRAIRSSGNNFIYQYDLKDHLGNTRVTFIPKAGDTTQTTLDVVQENSYYPFGMDMPNMNSYSGTKNKYLYNGKELQDDQDFNMYDYGARFYDPVVGRFTTIDPLAETYQRVSPYNYADNNPVNNIDPDGRGVEYGAGSITFTGQDAINAFNTLKNSQNGNDGGGGDDKDKDKKKEETSAVKISETINPFKSKNASFGLNVANDILADMGYAEGVIGATQIGMLSYRESLPVLSRIGTFSRFSSMYSTLGLINKGLGRLSFLGAGLDVGLNLRAATLPQGDPNRISWSRFGYRAIGDVAALGTSMYIGTTVGGPWGAVGGQR